MRLFVLFMSREGCISKRCQVITLYNFILKRPTIYFIFFLIFFKVKARLPYMHLTTLIN